MAEIRKNRVKHKLAAGQPVLVVSAHTPDTPDAFGELDFIDGFRMDMEHDDTSWKDLRVLSACCDLWGVTSLVRVERNDHHAIGKSLDMGVQGVYVPHVTTKQAGERAVDAAKYPPLGTRGITSPRQGVGVDNYFEKANDEIFVAVMVEDVEGIENLDELLTVEGIDCFLLGPGDLSSSLGYPGQLRHPEVRALMEKATKKINAAGRSVGTAVLSDEDLEVFIGWGIRFFWGSGQRYINQALRKVADRLQAE